VLLAVDVGNTQTALGLYDGEKLVESWRVATEADRTGDEIAALVVRLLELSDLGFDDVTDVALCSAVPLLVRAYQEVAERYAEAPLMVLGPGVKTGIPILYDDPREVGPDRIANAVAARERHGAPCIVVDFGTSTNFDAVSSAGEYVGGVLAPGIEISMDALFLRAARLTRVDFAEPRPVIGVRVALLRTPYLRRSTRGQGVGHVPIARPRIMPPMVRRVRHRPVDHVPLLSGADRQIRLHMDLVKTLPCGLARAGTV
jgi:type III pantothenate kinase